MESLLLPAHLRLPQGRQSRELVDLSLWNLDGRLLAYVILFQAVNQIPWGLCNNSKCVGMATDLDLAAATLSTANATPE
jgi:hypothetical protein